LAFIATAALLRTKLREEGTNFWDSVSFFKIDFRGFGIFSAKVFGLIVIAAILFLPADFILEHYPARVPISAGDSGYLVGALLMAAITYFVVPMSIQLLKSTEEAPVEAELRRRAQLLAVLALLTSGMIGYIALRIEPSFVSRSTPYMGVLVVQALGSLITATPFILLFIFVALVAIPNDAQEAASESRSEGVDGTAQFWE
jgi:hypothetical protein